MKLSSRLQCIADRIDKNTYIADIGTDHAYIPIYLIRRGICSRVIGTDVRTGPLNRAERNVRLYGLQDRIELRKGYGLSPVAYGEIDCAVMAGMGGFLLCDILEKEKEKAQKIEKFIIQPVQAPEAIREYLYINDYRIYDEVLVKEKGKIYQIMTVGHGTEYIDDSLYFEIGKKLIDRKDPLLTELIEGKIDELTKVIHKIGNEDTENALNRLEECKYSIKRLEEVLKCL